MSYLKQLQPATPRKALPECVNDFATPCVINLLRMVVLFQSFSFAQVVG